MVTMDSLSDKELMILRGQYATVRAAHEDAKKQMSVLCGRLQSVASKVLRRIQPDNDDVPESVADLLAEGREALNSISDLSIEIESLAAQRNTLKPQAWGK